MSEIRPWNSDIFADLNSTAPPLPRRTLRSGREFSAFDLALGIDFDIQQCLHDRLLEQQSVGQDHEPEEKIAGSALECPSFLPNSPPSSSAATSSVVPPSSSDRNKLKSKARRAKARDRAQQASENPRLKGIHRTRINEAKPAYLEPLPRHGETGMGGRLYSQAEVDALTGTIGFTYIAWLGLLTIPILDSRRRIIALLGGTPKDVEGWTKEEKLDHRRAQHPFAAVGRGLSHGGGQMEPGELQQNVTNTRVTDELMAHSYFQRIVGFTNMLFAMWAPDLFQVYQEVREALKHLKWNFAESVFASMHI
ncbi:hypothetical protein B0H14DRAFT_3539856 [Mycena olivaceomarginata]|nr:hypothetical protein B0H14DRAFT_3539856 [Mycena olivaceomarginata]